jgi:hypothetical protein
MPTEPSLRRRRGRRVGSLITAVACLTLGAAAAGDAHDSLAPPGAPHTWLPQEDWIAYHWLPFDEQALNRALGLRGRELEAYLYDDHHTLARLASRRGMAVETLANQLVEPWRGRVDESRLDMLRARTVRVLTQGHLAQHVLFHLFHNGGASREIAARLGTSTRWLMVQRRRGLTWLQIAHRQQVPQAVLEQQLITSLAARAHQGVELGVASRSESDRILARQLTALPCWLHRPHPAIDAGNPYGKATLQHGEHRRGWPRTARERRHDETQVERVRASLEPSCWRGPPRWRWVDHPGVSATTAAARVQLNVITPRRTLCRLALPARVRRSTRRRLTVRP